MKVIQLPESASYLTRLDFAFECLLIFDFLPDISVLIYVTLFKSLVESFTLYISFFRFASVFYLAINSCSNLFILYRAAILPEFISFSPEFALSLDCIPTFPNIPKALLPLTSTEGLYESPARLPVITDPALLLLDMFGVLPRAFILLLRISALL